MVATPYIAIKLLSTPFNLKLFPGDYILPHTVSACRKLMAASINDILSLLTTPIMWLTEVGFTDRRLIASFMAVPSRTTAKESVDC